MDGESFPLSFDDLMIQGDAAHNDGRIAEALKFAAKAYTVAEPGSIDQGRAARGVAARYDRLGDFELANSIVEETIGEEMGEELALPMTEWGWLEESLRIHKNAANADPSNPWALRELGYGCMYSGVFLAKQLITQVCDGQNVLSEDKKQATGYLERALLHVNDATRIRVESGKLEGLKLDQYTINFLGRAAIVQSVFGSRFRGMRHAVHALRVAKFSESPEIDTSNTSLDDEKRSKAVRKARKRGAAAFLTSVAADFMPRSAANPIWRKVVLPLAERTL